MPGKGVEFSYLACSMARLWEPLWSPAIKIHPLVWYTQKKAASPRPETRCHNIECATWATRLVCQVEVTGLASGLQNVYLGSVKKKIMGFI